MLTPYLLYGATMILTQCLYLLGIVAFLFCLFEILPLFFKQPSTIAKNYKDLLIYQILVGIYSIFFFAFLVTILYLSKSMYGLIPLLHFHPIIQFLILYTFIDFTIYCSHLLSHKYGIPLLTRAHAFHHTIRDDLEWVNGRKEHLFVVSLFISVFVFYFFVFFETSSFARGLTVFTFLTFLSFSHYRLPLSLPILDKFFLFPKDHRRHHTERSGPYGVTLSIFDTLLKTRK